jgi:hypothetical protein
MGSYLAIGSLVARNGAIGAFPSGLNDFFYAGLTGIGVGAGLMIGGFSLAAANGTPSTAVEPTPAIVQRRALTDMGVSVSGTF